MGISLGIIFGIISMLGYGLSNAIAQVPTKIIGSKKTVFLRNIFSSIFLLVVLLFFLSEANFSLTFILIAFAISFIAYLPLLTLYKSLKLGKVGVVVPIGNSYIIFTVLFSLIFFKETLNLSQVFSIFLIIIGIISISINFKDIKESNLFKITSGIPYALLTCFLWGLVMFLFRIPVNILGPILTSFIIELGVLIFNSIHLKLSKLSFSLPSKKILTYAFFIGLFAGVGTLFYNLGIRAFSVSIVAAITSASPIISVLYGKFVYNEKLKIQQYLSILIILMGLILISL